jgi:hypothetical protein
VLRILIVLTCPLPADAFVTPAIVAASAAGSASRLMLAFSAMKRKGADTRK